MVMVMVIMVMVIVSATGSIVVVVVVMIVFVVLATIREGSQLHSLMITPQGPERVDALALWDTNVDATVAVVVRDQHQRSSR